MVREITEEEFTRRTAGEWTDKDYFNHPSGWYEIDLDAAPFCTVDQMDAISPELVGRGYIHSIDGWAPGPKGEQAKRIFRERRL